MRGILLIAFVVGLLTEITHAEHVGESRDAGRPETNEAKPLTSMNFKVLNNTGIEEYKWEASTTCLLDNKTVNGHETKRLSILSKESDKSDASSIHIELGPFSEDNENYNISHTYPGDSTPFIRIFLPREIIDNAPAAAFDHPKCTVKLARTPNGKQLNGSFDCQNLARDRYPISIGQRRRVNVQGSFNCRYLR